MTEITRNFASGVMNKDIDERLLPDGQYRDALNITVGSSEGSNVGSVQNILGNEQVGDIYLVANRPAQNARTIGSHTVESTNIIFWLVASDFFDAIFELDVASGVVTRVLQSNKVDASTPSKLNFNQSYLVTGINYISGLLFWTDNNEQPYKVNITRAKSYSVDDPRIDDDIRVIVKPPLNAPYITMSNDGTQSNNMSEKFLYFAYRFKYIDNEYSSMSPFTTAAFIPDSYAFDPQKGYNSAMVNSINKVGVTMETGNEFVKEIQLIMLDSSSKSVFIIESFNKLDLNIPNDFSYKFSEFSNNKTYTPLPSNQVTRLFDNVPLRAKSQEIVGSRLVYGNYTQFYDIVDENGANINVDFDVSYVSDLAVPTQSNPLPSFRSDRDAEIGIVYGDIFGRLTTALTSLTNTVYVKPEDSYKSNSLVVKIKSPAPTWATFWRLVIKQSKSNYYNLFPILFYKDGNYRYFLLNDSDIDKVSVGEYVIFKAGPDGVTGSNKQYKVLEIAQKPAGFISSGVTEIAGLYFKIKVDNATEFNPSSLFTYNSIGEGVNTTSDGLVNNGETAVSPVLGAFSVAENPIFYGDGNGSALTVSNGNQYFQSVDLRYTIEIDTPTTFRYTTAIDGGAPYILNPVTIVANTDIPIYAQNGISVAFYIRFSTATGFVVGDKWKISCRGQVPGTYAWLNYFGGIGLSQLFSGTPSGLVGGYAIVPGSGWSPNSSTEVDRPINVGAVITLAVISDKYNPSQQAGLQQFPPSDRNYRNIEEWFIESGAYSQFQQYDQNGNDVGATRISFRRGTGYSSSAGSDPGADLTNFVTQGNAISPMTLSYPVRMFIAGFGVDDGPNNQNHIKVGFSIQQQNNSNIVETVPKPTDIDIYHELSRTYPVDSGDHVVNWDYEDFVFWPSSGPTNGYTALIQLNPSRPHVFEVGETVYVTTSAPGISGARRVIEVPDQFTVVIDLLFPGSGPTTPGKIAHNLIDMDQSSFPNIAKVVINNPSNKNSNYNSWSFGNGLESNRIKDDFNQSTLEYSIRATSIIEDYKQTLNESALTYSGVFKENTSVNRLNEFNLSEANFKYLDKSFGSVQKIFTRDTDLLVLQENKISTVLYGKNILSDSIGGGQVASVPEVLGTQIALQYEYGISKNPESFASWGSDVFFSDSYRGVILQLSGNSVDEISKYGMKDYFRDIFKGQPNTQRLGVFDPYHRTYTLSANDISVIPCNLNIVPSKLVTQGMAQPNLFLFEITSDSSWSISVKDIGFGTSWLTEVALSGSGDSVITGNLSANSTIGNRSLLIEVAYCGGLLKGFILTQGKGMKTELVSIIFNNMRTNESLSSL